MSVFGLVLLCFFTEAIAVEDEYISENITEQSFTPLSPEEEALSLIKIEGLKGRFGGELVIQYDPDIPSSETLFTNGYLAQPPNSDLCGPYSAHNLLLNWGKNITITRLITGTPRLNYTAGNGTAFDQNWVLTLNYHTNSNYYVRTAAPSQNTIWNTFVGDTLDGHPFILHVRMSPGNGYLPGYSSPQLVGHYVTGNGYRNYRSSTPTAKMGRYFDCNNRAGAYGQHELSLPKWPNLLRERGIIH